MLINRNAIKKLCHDKGKRCSASALEYFDIKLRDLVEQSCCAANGAKTVQGRDVVNFRITIY